MKTNQTRCTIAIALVVAFLLILFPTSVLAEESSNLTITKIYVGKAAYYPGQSAHVDFVVLNSGADVQKTANVAISHLEDVVWSTSLTVNAAGGTTTTVGFDWQTPNTDYRGYLVQITLDGSTYVSAIDVSSDISRYPRYGYTVDFFPGETAQESDTMMKELAQVYHINLVQYYDWMYRHEKTLPDTGDEFTDMFGHTLSATTIQQRIDAGHAYNQKAMAYQMSYMAREGYENYGVNKEWGLYSNPTERNISYDPADNSTISDIDQYIFPLEGKPAPILFAFNPLNSSWQNFMANQYKSAINELDFDGIQIDQMGDYWGSNVTYYDYSGNTVNLGNSFAAFTNAIKAQLSSNNTTKDIVTMNAVNGGENDYFSSNAIITDANTDFAFSELWGNSDTYKKVYDFVNWQKRQDGGKTMVLAAYMNQYDINGDTYYYDDASLHGVHTNTDEDLMYITGFDETGDKAELTVTVPESGNYSLVFYAANGTDTKASKSIYVDGIKHMTAYFDSTRPGSIPAEPDWHTYSYEASYTSPKNLYLTAGTHTLSIQQDANDIGGDIRLHSVTFGTYDIDSIKLSNAAIAASGAMHIELGSGMSTTSNSGTDYCEVSLLGNPYYPKAAKSMTSDTQEAMLAHYQFITAYENLLYDEDVLPSDTGLQNISIANENISGDATPGTIWYVIKNKGNDYGIIHLINLTNETDADWRNTTNEPSQKSNLTVKYYFPQYKSVEGVYLASPDDGCVSQALQYSVNADNSGKYIEIAVPSLKYWDMIYIAYSDEVSGTQIEAEQSILSGVNIAANHIGYSGTGFVDSYGEQGDSVTMDFYVAADGNYTLEFAYSAVVHADPVRQIYINGVGHNTITFPVNSSWDEWETSSMTVNLHQGIHRMVIYTGSDDSGYINLDYVKIIPAS